MPKLNVSAVLTHLLACEGAVARTRAAISLGGFDAKKIREPKVLPVLFGRIRLANDLKAISRLLANLKCAKLDSKFPAVFENFDSIKRQSDEVTRLCAVCPEEIKWDQLIQVANHEYPKLVSAINEAIKQFEPEVPFLSAMEIYEITRCPVCPGEMQWDELLDGIEHQYRDHKQKEAAIKETMEKVEKKIRGDIIKHYRK